MTNTAPPPKRRLADSWHALQGLPWVGLAAALGSVALVSLVIDLLGAYLPVTNLSVLYLIAVLAIAVAFGRWLAVLVSVLSFLVFDWFFVNPRHTFTVAAPAEWITLLLFLLTAVITGQLAAGQRQRAQEAEQREREAVVLYDVLRLLGRLDLPSALADVAERLRRELDLVAVEVRIEDDEVSAEATAGDPEALRLMRSVPLSAARVLGGGRAPTDAQRGAPGPWVRIVPPSAADLRRRGMLGDRPYLVPVRVSDRRVGEILLLRRPGSPRFSAADDRLLSAVAAQIGSAVDRARLRREATEAEILRRTDETKTALLNAVSHDLRTPLSSIIASAGSLLQRDVAWSEEDRRQFAESIEEEARRLNQIVGNLLDLSRMESGALRPEMGWYDVGALVDDVLGRLKPLTSQHRLVVSIPDDLPPVRLDYVEIDQVLSNLIENAVKYAPPGTEVDVVARQVDRELEVAVCDRGPGIPPAALARLFEPFYRAKGQGPQPKGTGLGLAVAKGLVEAHGGRIWAENRPGGGTKFALRLPLARLDEPAALTEEE